MGMFTKRDLIMTHHNSAVTHGPAQLETVCRRVRSMHVQAARSEGKNNHTAGKLLIYVLCIHI